MYQRNLPPQKKKPKPKLLQYFFNIVSICKIFLGPSSVKCFIYSIYDKVPIIKQRNKQTNKSQNLYQSLYLWKLKTIPLRWNKQTENPLNEVLFMSAWKADNMISFWSIWCLWNVPLRPLETRISFHLHKQLGENEACFPLLSAYRSQL